MFGNNFVVKLVLIWCLICAVLVECRRQKKDVHHMIILGNRDKSRPVRGHRYSSGRHKRRPSSKKKPVQKYPTYSSEESHSFEEDFSEERPKPKRHHHHSHRPTASSFYEQDNNIQPFIPQQTFPEVKWQPMSSQELFGNFPQPSTHQNHFRMFPGGYQRGAIHYSQPIPVEITTPYAMPSYESTETFSTKDAYKPFDYSVLTEKTVSDTKAVTPFSIVVEGSTEKVNKTTVRGWGVRNKGKRGRGSGKFEFGQKENKS